MADTPVLSDLDVVHDILAATYPEGEVPEGSAVALAHDVFERLAKLEGENEGYREMLQEVESLRREHKAATELLTRIARAIAKARVPVPEGPLDVRVAYLAGRPA